MSARKRRSIESMARRVVERFLARWELAARHRRRQAVGTPAFQLDALERRELLTAQYVYIDDAVAAEAGPGSVDVKVHLLEPCPAGQSVSVRVAYSDGLAISGTDYSGCLSTVTFGPGEMEKTTNWNILNDGVVEPDESFELHLELVSAPSGTQILDDSATVTIADNDGPAVGLIMPDVYVREPVNGARETLRPVIHLSSPAPSAFTAYVRTVPGVGSATPGLDYAASAPSLGAVSFAQGATSGEVLWNADQTVEIKGDEFAETSVETFELELYYADSRRIVDGAATVHIIESGDLIQAWADDVIVREGFYGEQHGNYIGIPVHLSARPTDNHPITLRLDRGSDYDSAGYQPDYGGCGGTVDYGGYGGTVTFQAVGDDYPLTQTVWRFRVWDDDACESDESFDVELSEPVNDPQVQIARTCSYVTIVDDELMSVPGVYARDFTVTEGESPSVTVVLHLTEPAFGYMAVAYSTYDGGATSGLDYNSRSGIVEFAAGTTTAEVVIPLTDDSLLESLEQFHFVLYSPENLRVRHPDVTITIVCVRRSAGA